MAGYSEFRIRIEPGTRKGHYRVDASGLGGEKTGVFRVPFRDSELENFVLKVGRTRRGVRRISSPEWDLAKTFGGRLFSSLMEGPVGELYRSSLSTAQATGDGVRITLSLTEVPELAEIPWEYLFDPPNFLAISTSTPIVRYLDVAKPRRPLEVALPIRILAVVSAPSDVEELDTGDERQRLESALKPLIDAKAVAIDWLEEATLLALTKKLQPDTYHILHFIGHGGFDDASGEGALLFEDAAGRGRPVSGEQLATVLNNKASLRLVFLNSCEGARASIQDPFSGVASSLIQREIPAVIAMQFEITDRAAIIFAGEFYAVLAEGQPVDSAVTHARLMVFADQNDVEWGTPVLFMRVADGRLFNVADAPALPRVAPEDLPPKTAATPPPTTAAPGMAAGGAALPLAGVASTVATPETGPPAVGPAAPSTAVPPVADPSPASAPAEPPDATSAPDAATATAAAAVVRVAAPVAIPESTGPAMTPPTTTHPPVGPGTSGRPDEPTVKPDVKSDPTPGVTSRIPWRLVAVGAVALVLLVLLVRVLVPPDTSGSLSVSTVGASQTGLDHRVRARTSCPPRLIDVSLDGDVVKTVARRRRRQVHHPDRYRAEDPRRRVGRRSVRSAGQHRVLGGSERFGEPERVGRRKPHALECVPAGEHDDWLDLSRDPLLQRPFPGVDEKGDNELYLLDPVTRVETRLTSNANADSFPAWSPNHEEIVFDRDGDLKIAAFAGGKLGTSVEALTTGGSNDNFPAWSIDDRIAFARFLGGNNGSEIRVIRRGGNSELVVAGKSVRAPAWSPDGTTLAYMADNGSGQFDIFTIKEGEEPVPLLDGPLSELNPNWSPDGKTIVFVRDKGEPKSYDNDIFKVDVATKEVTGPLTDNDVQDGNPVWSPDGSQIAFYRALEASATTGFHIWIMNADGSGQEDLMLDRPGRNLDPMWR